MQAGNDNDEPCPNSQVGLSENVSATSAWVWAAAAAGSIAAMSTPATRLMMDRFLKKLSPTPP
jgi:hypothetical protein